ncbi:hypothetical protein [Inquilinus sp. OTU3971]|uniref:hypothetical protein n=1 Tax=Inquilinus sp. OTU3971 TaxID=3043855 RepID=UPI00313A960F
MERVAFLIEPSGDRISCLLNPEDLELRRVAGLRARRGAGGIVTGHARSDDPLIATGGGATEIDLRLLFDIEIAQEGRQGMGPAQTAPLPMGPTDVRELTRPLWDLAENGEGADGYGAPPVVRFIWGKSWNILGVVLAVAERLERFDTAGAPGRSWLSLRLRRVAESESRPVPRQPVTPQFETQGPEDQHEREHDAVLEIPADQDGLLMLRLDQIAADRYGSPDLARPLAEYNGLDDLLRSYDMLRLSLPPISSLTGRP